jgi:hypothetical protein
MAATVALANAGPYDDTEPHSCRHCQKIVVTDAMQLDYGDWAISIPYSRRAARKAAAEGCLFFELLLPLFSYKVLWEYLTETVRILLHPRSYRSDDPKTGIPRLLWHRMVGFCKSLISPTSEMHIRAKWKEHKILLRNLDKELSDRNLCAYVTAGMQLWR